MKEGDVIGCLFCRKSGRIIFFLNGDPQWAVPCEEILLPETWGEGLVSPLGSPRDRLLPRLRTGSSGFGNFYSSPASRDMYITIGVLGKGDLEINFGGKNFSLNGEISRVSRGLVQSTAPVAARAFGYRLARFHVMLVRLHTPKGLGLRV